MHHEGRAWHVWKDPFRSYYLFSLHMWLASYVSLKNKRFPLSVPHEVERQRWDVPYAHNFCHRKSNLPLLFSSSHLGMSVRSALQKLCCKVQSTSVIWGRSTSLRVPIGQNHLDNWRIPLPNRGLEVMLQIREKGLWNLWQASCGPEITISLQ